MEPKTVNKIFFKRFNLIEKVKDSEVFGIVIGSLSIQNLNKLIDKIKITLKSQNKKFYQMLLGKITDEKLANFVEYIDCFILIACPFSDFYNNKALMKPLVSPLDIKIAFDPNYSWDMIYSYDINYIIQKEKCKFLSSNYSENENAKDELNSQKNQENFKDNNYDNINEKYQALKLIE